MNLYGYESDNFDDLQTLREVSVIASHEELLALSAFFAKCAYEIKSQKNWQHAHFKDFVHKASDTDIIISVPHQ